MVNMNESMKKLLQESNEEISMVDSIIEDIVSKTKLIRDCVIYDEFGELDEDKINFNVVLKFTMDWTGFEMSHNELRFSKEEIPSNQFVYFAERLDTRLSQKYEGRKFGIIISIVEGDSDVSIGVDDEREVRFHTYRENEGLWLDKDLNKYGTPILYRV